MAYKELFACISSDAELLGVTMIPFFQSGTYGQRSHFIHRVAFGLLGVLVDGLVHYFCWWDFRVGIGYTSRMHTSI